MSKCWLQTKGSRQGNIWEKGGGVITLPSPTHPVSSSPRSKHKDLLTLIIRKLQVVVHGSHKFLHKVATHIGSQVNLTVHLALQDSHVVV